MSKNISKFTILYHPQLKINPYSPWFRCIQKSYRSNPARWAFGLRWKSVPSLASGNRAYSTADWVGPSVVRCWPSSNQFAHPCSIWCEVSTEHDRSVGASWPAGLTAVVVLTAAEEAGSALPWHCDASAPIPSYWSAKSSANDWSAAVTLTCLVGACWDAGLRPFWQAVAFCSPAEQKWTPENLWNHREPEIFNLFIQYTNQIKQRG